jgi:predicted ATPase
MIETIHLKNFKCLEDTKKLDLKPLTILCGTNSSGKSSIIQTLLMLKQTFESQSRYKNIVLNGQFVHLGPFEDLVFKKNLEKEVQIKFDLNIQNISTDKRAVDSYINFGKKEKQGLKKRLLEVVIGLKTQEGHTDKDPYVENFKITAKSLLKSDTYIEGTEIKFERKESKDYTVSWKNVLSSFPFFYEAPDIKPPKEKEFYKCPICNSKHRTNSQIGKDHYRYYWYIKSSSENKCDVKASFLNLVPEIIIGSDKEYLKFPVNHINRILFLLRHILEDEFSNLYYIGPLREEPSRRYIAEEETISIGNRGQNAPFVLATAREKTVSPYYIFDPNEEKWENINGDTLDKAVDRWLKYMGISERCELITEREIIRLYLPTYIDKNVKATLADVGFGVSQILPILVEGLRIRPSQTLILEQPEIHLHPKLQMQLADFFISMILSGKNLLLETHSDHIINRISRRVIEDEENKIISKTNILFFEQENENPINPVELDPERGVINWPSGFFDQSPEEKRLILSKGIERRTKNKVIN